ncbi:uncharacterized protein LOC142342232 [Convolutriloba macropyga]|uniref:uncharacterized protein LOC142342232 n=1 Tax=Convolutriloba macropyga TaxID=536237 RepID=UPI003F523AE0
MGSTSTKENSPANTLREAVLYESVFESSLEGDNSFCEPGTICTDCVRKNTNICLYDDGSPLYEFECQLKVPKCLYGIASYYIQNTAKPDELCTAGSVFTRISYHEHWIMQIMSKR